MREATLKALQLPTATSSYEKFFFDPIDRLMAGAQKPVVLLASSEHG
jgi:hypothetical protein